MTNADHLMDVDTLRAHLQKFDLYDCTLLGLLLLLSLVIGFFFVFHKNRIKKSAKSIKQDSVELQVLHGTEKSAEELKYLIGNRNMKELPVAMSLVASFISGISIIGLSTEIYMYGILYAYTIPTMLLAGIICWYIFLPIFCDLQMTSLYEYLEMRFDKKIRLFGSFVNFVGITFWMPMVIYVPGLVMNQFTGVASYWTAAIISLVCVFYTSMGGITAVIWTDCFQNFVMFASVILIMLRGMFQFNSLSEIFQINYEGSRLDLPELSLDPTIRYSLAAILIGGTVSWTEATCCGQVMMQRFLSVSSVRKARKVLIYYIIGIMLIIGVCVFNGLILFAHYHDCDPLTTKLVAVKDQLLPIYIMEIFFQIPGMNGIFLGGIASAALSTLSTGLNSLAAIFLEDFVKSIRTTPLTKLQTRLILQSVVCALGLVSFILSLYIASLGMIFQLSRVLSALSGGPLFGIFLIGALMPWINTKGALVGCCTSFVFMAWICIDAQIGKIEYAHKPLEATGCNYTFQSNNETVIHPLDAVIESRQEHISYLWYSPLGALIAILVANMAQLAFGFTERSDWNPKLIATFLRKHCSIK